MEKRQETPQIAESSHNSSSHTSLLICLLVFLATLAVYGQARQFGFVNFDDPDYVTNNIHVREGITPESVAWAFASGEVANWSPVTWLSYMLDYQLFGMQSGWYHVTNVLFHALAAVLLFMFLDSATKARWPSALVAFLFALHPLHVESVAWISERKDVLSAFFWFLTLWAYLRYTRRPGASGYIFFALPFCLGLMAKSMVVTLPFVLLLLDVWPLRRIVSGNGSWKGAVWEKLPLFALSGASAAATYVIQKNSGAAEVLSIPAALRLENALVSYVVYIAKMFWPAGLAVFYPYPADIPGWQAAIAGIAVLAISVQVVRWFRFYPYLAVGWFWYLGTLAPVIGLIQVGAQARADRYTYLPMVGLCIMLAWGGADFVRHRPRAKAALTALAAAACAACVALTWLQVQYWRSSESLFRHAIEVTSANYIAEHNLGTELMGSDERLPEAIQHLEAALGIQPNSARTHTDLGTALSRIPGRLPEAISQYEAALRITPDSAITHNNLGNTLSRISGRLPDAIAEYETALRLRPDYEEARKNLALVRSGGATDSAEEQFNQGVALAKDKGSLPEAIQHFEAALRLRPDYPEAQNNLGVALSQMPGRSKDAISHFEAALRTRPDYADAHVNLAVALSEIPGRLPDAIAQLEAALKIQPDPEVRQMLERLRAAQGRQ